MGGAHQSMHGPRRTNFAKFVQAICKHFATPPETPPPPAGNGPVSNRQPRQSTNETAKMQNRASLFRKISVAAESRRPDDRRRFPTSCPEYDSRQGDCKRNEW